jgi:hypothetical protein
MLVRRRVGDSRFLASRTFDGNELPGMINALGRRKRLVERHRGLVTERDETADAASGDVAAKITAMTIDDLEVGARTGLDATR